MISAELQKLYAGDTTNVVLDTLQLDHPNFSQTFYLVNDRRDWQFQISAGVYQTFLSMPFGVKLPDKNVSGRQEITIVMSNIHRIISDEVEQAIQNPSTNITCTYRAYLNIVDRLPEITPALTLNISEVVITPTQLTAVASRFDVLNKAFPSRVFRDYEFPGLLR